MEKLSPCSFLYKIRICLFMISSNQTYTFPLLQWIRRGAIGSTIYMPNYNLGWSVRQVLIKVSLCFYHLKISQDSWIGVNACQKSQETRRSLRIFDHTSLVRSYGWTWTWISRASDQTCSYLARRIRSYPNTTWETRRREYVQKQCSGGRVLVPQRSVAYFTISKNKARFKNAIISIVSRKE